MSTTTLASDIIKEVGLYISSRADFVNFSLCNKLYRQTLSTIVVRKARDFRNSEMRDGISRAKKYELDSDDIPIPPWIGSDVEDFIDCYLLNDHSLYEVIKDIIKERQWRFHDGDCLVIDFPRGKIWSYWDNGDFDVCQNIANTPQIHSKFHCPKYHPHYWGNCITDDLIWLDAVEYRDSLSKVITCSIEELGITIDVRYVTFFDSDRNRTCYIIAYQPNIKEWETYRLLDELHRIIKEIVNRGRLIALSNSNKLDGIDGINIPADKAHLVYVSYLEDKSK